MAYDHAGLLGKTGAVPAERLAAIPTPALVMSGNSGLPFMKTTAKTIAHALPHAELRILDGQTHDVQPAVLAPILKEFFLKG